MTFDWPIVDIEKINPSWWQRVMQGSSVYEEIFQKDRLPQLDFTARAMVFVVTNRSRPRVEWFFSGSSKLNMVLDIYDRLQVVGANKVEILKDLVTEFYNAHDRYLKQQS